MREIRAELVADVVARLCFEANIYADSGVRRAIEAARGREAEGLALGALDMIVENMRVAADEKMPLCQDTGMAVVFVDLGQDVHVVGDLNAAIDDGVRRGYRDCCFRASVVADPVRRVNTGDNTPAVVHYNIVAGDRIGITVAPKGFGSENKGKLKMLNPSDGLDGVVSFVVETVKSAGADCCPPVVVGVGVGGSMEKAALMAKRALTLDINENNADPFWAGVERDLLEKINKLRIGAAGLGGATTALGVRIMTFPTHIAGLPVAVNVGCHVTRHKFAEI